MSWKYSWPVFGSLSDSVGQVLRLSFKNKLTIYMLTLYSIYAKERKAVVVGIFLAAFLSTLAVAAVFAFWELGDAFSGELRGILGVGRYVVFPPEGAKFTMGDAARAAAALCSDRAYGVAYVPVKVAYVNGTERWVTAAFVPRGAVEGVRLLEAVASRHVASEGDVFYVYVHNRPYMLTTSRVLEGALYVPGLSADLYLDAELLGASRFDVLVVEKGACGGVEDLRALFPRASVLDTDLLLSAFWGQLLLYLAGASAVAASSAAAVAALNYTLAMSTLYAHWKDFAVMRVVGMKRRQLLALAAMLFYAPALMGAATAAFLASGVHVEGFNIDVGAGAAKAAALVAAFSALPLIPAFRKLYALQPVEALRYE